MLLPLLADLHHGKHVGIGQQEVVYVVDGAADAGGVKPHLARGFLPPLLSRRVEDPTASA